MPVKRGVKLWLRLLMNPYVSHSIPEPRPSNRIRLYIAPRPAASAAQAPAYRRRHTLLTDASPPRANPPARASGLWSRRNVSTSVNVNWGTGLRHLRRIQRDNIFLNNDNKRYDFITGFTPSVSLLVNRPRFQLAAGFANTSDI